MPAVARPVVECLHCNRRGGDAGRGLCDRCYRLKSVRHRYARRCHCYGRHPEPTEEELNALIAEQTATLGTVPEDEADGAAAPPPPQEDYDPPFWQLWLVMSRCVARPLHPATAPESISRDQRRAVSGAVAELGAGWTVEAVSELVVLPVDVVRRRLKELRLRLL